MDWQNKGGPENPKAKRRQTNRINAWLLAPPFLLPHQLFRMWDHEDMRLQDLRQFFFHLREGSTLVAQLSIKVDDSVARKKE